MESKEFDYINVIPLVDIMLVLLTIVLTTSTFIATGVIPLQLPKAAKAEDLATSRTQAVEIDAEGRVYLNSKPVTLEGLRDAMSWLDRSVPVLIKADRKLALQVFVGVLDVVKGLEFKTVSLQTERAP